MNDNDFNKFLESRKQYLKHLRKLAIKNPSLAQKYIKEDFIDIGIKNPNISNIKKGKR